MSIAAKRALFTIAFVASLGVSNSTHAQEKTVKIYGFGAKSGVVGIFGQQSEAAMQAGSMRTARPMWRPRSLTRCLAFMRLATPYLAA